MVTRSPSQLFATLHNVDGSLGAYYLVMHGWTIVFGDSPAALRMPSALAMAGAAACIALLGRLVVHGTPADPLQTLPAAQAAALRAHYRVTGTKRLTGLSVAVLQRTD